MDLQKIERSKVQAIFLTKFGFLATYDVKMFYFGVYIFNRPLSIYPCSSTFSREEEASWCLILLFFPSIQKQFHVSVGTPSSSWHCSSFIAAAAHMTTRCNKN